MSSVKPEADAITEAMTAGRDHWVANAHAGVGESEYIVAVEINGESPTVSLIENAGDHADFTSDEARGLARGLLTAADLAEGHTAEPQPPPWSVETPRLIIRNVTAPIQHIQHESQAGRTRKLSVTLPENLVEEVRERTGERGFSRYVAEAVARQVELDKLKELDDALTEEFGSPSAEDLSKARVAWPDAEA